MSRITARTQAAALALPIPAPRHETFFTTSLAVETGMFEPKLDVADYFLPAEDKILSPPGQLLTQHTLQLQV